MLDEQTFNVNFPLENSVENFWVYIVAVIQKEKKNWA